MKFAELLETAKAEGSFDDVIDTGDFTIEAVRANAKDRDDGTATIGVQWKVLGGTEDMPLADDDSAIGQQSWTNLYFTEKAAGMSIRALKSWGFDDEFINGVEAASEISDVIPGIRLEASVTQRKWGKDEANTSNEIKVHKVLVGPTIQAKAASKSKAKAAPKEDEAY